MARGKGFGMKTATRILTLGLLLVLLGTLDVQAGRMFGGKTKPAPPKWCFCARVCAGFGAPVNNGHVPEGQSLRICPRIHEEVIYDNLINCSCPYGGPAQQPQGMSPNR